MTGRMPKVIFPVVGLSAHSAPLETFFKTGVMLFFLPLVALVFDAKRLLVDIEHKRTAARLPPLEY